MMPTREHEPAPAAPRYGQHEPQPWSDTPAQQVEMRNLPPSSPPSGSSRNLLQQSGLRSAAIIRHAPWRKGGQSAGCAAGPKQWMLENPRKSLGIVVGVVAVILLIVIIVDVVELQKLKDVSVTLSTASVDNLCSNDIPYDARLAVHNPSARGADIDAATVTATHVQSGRVLGSLPSPAIALGSGALSLHLTGALSLADVDVFALMLQQYVEGKRVDVRFSASLSATVKILGVGTSVSTNFEQDISLNDLVNEDPGDRQFLRWENVNVTVSNSSFLSASVAVVPTRKSRFTLSLPALALRLRAQPSNKTAGAINTAATTLTEGTGTINATLHAYESDESGLAELLSGVAGGLAASTSAANTSGVPAAESVTLAPGSAPSPSACLLERAMYLRPPSLAVQSAADVGNGADAFEVANVTVDSLSGTTVRVNASADLVSTVADFLETSDILSQFVLDLRAPGTQLAVELTISTLSLAPASGGRRKVSAPIRAQVDDLGVALKEVVETDIETVEVTVRETGGADTVLSRSLRNITASVSIPNKSALLPLEYAVQGSPGGDLVVDITAGRLGGSDALFLTVPELSLSITYDNNGTVANITTNGTDIVSGETILRAVVFSPSSGGQIEQLVNRVAVSLQDRGIPLGVQGKFSGGNTISTSFVYPLEKNITDDIIKQVCIDSISVNVFTSLASLGCSFSAAAAAVVNNPLPFSIDATQMNFDLYFDDPDGYAITIIILTFSGPPQDNVFLTSIAEPTSSTTAQWPKTVASSASSRLTANVGAAATIDACARAYDEYVIKRRLHTHVRNGRLRVRISSSFALNVQFAFDFLVQNDGSSSCSV